MRGCIAWYRFLLDHWCTLGRQRGWCSVAGGCGSIWSHYTLLTPSEPQNHPMSQVKSKLSIFLSSDICYISQKWYLNNHVVKSCFNKTSFHVQFYIMRTFQNALAHVNITLLMRKEKMNSDGKTHEETNTCTRVSVCTRICMHSTSEMGLLPCLSAVILSLNKEILLQEGGSCSQLIWQNLCADGQHKASSDCTMLYKASLEHTTILHDYESRHDYFL